MVFRGVSMKDSWINDWRECVDMFGLKYINKKGMMDFDKEMPANIQLQGDTSTTESFRTALQHCYTEDQ